MTKVKGKVIWITGASSGIGEALAYELAKKGAKIILSARRKEELNRVKGNCVAESQPDVRVLSFDLTKPETLKLSTEAAIQLFGHVDILINNGGISQRSFAKETLIDVDRRLMEVNYFGAVALTKNILPHFFQRKSGHVVTVTSVTGKFGTPYRSGYAASKHALHGFFDSLRAELWKDVKNEIAVTLICPGFIHTPITLAAVTGDGSPLGKMDEGQYQGMPAD